MAEKKGASTPKELEEFLDNTKEKQEKGTEIYLPKNYTPPDKKYQEQLNSLKSLMNTLKKGYNGPEERITNLYDMFVNLETAQLESDERLEALEGLYKALFSKVSELEKIILTNKEMQKTSPPNYQATVNPAIKTYGPPTAPPKNIVIKQPQNTQEVMPPTQQAPNKPPTTLPKELTNPPLKPPVIPTKPNNLNPPNAPPIKQDTDNTKPATTNLSELRDELSKELEKLKKIMHGS